MIFAAGSPQDAWRVFESHYAVKSEDERERVEDEWNELRRKEGENRTSKNSESRYNTLPDLKRSRPRKHVSFPATTPRATTPHRSLFSGYHAEGYHAPSIPHGLSRPGLSRLYHHCMAITPVYISRLSRQSIFLLLGYHTRAITLYHTRKSGYHTRHSS